MDLLRRIFYLIFWNDRLKIPKEGPWLICGFLGVLIEPVFFGGSWEKVPGIASLYLFILHIFYRNLEDARIRIRMKRYELGDYDFRS